MTFKSLKNLDLMHKLFLFVAFANILAWSDFFKPTFENVNQLGQIEIHNSTLVCDSGYEWTSPNPRQAEHVYFKSILVSSATSNQNISSRSKNKSTKKLTNPASLKFKTTICSLQNNLNLKLDKKNYSLINLKQDYISNGLSVRGPPLS